MLYAAVAKGVVWGVFIAKTDAKWFLENRIGKCAGGRVMKVRPELINFGDLRRDTVGAIDKGDLSNVV